MRAALSLNLLFSVSVPPGFYDRWIYRKIKQTPLFSQIFHIAADFARRRILWRHRNKHSVKERLFLSSKNGINSFAFSSHPIYKSYIGQTNRNKSRYSFGLYSFICSDRSCGLLSITWHRYTQCWEIQWSSQIHCGINNISVRSCEKHSIRHRIMLKLQTSEQTPLMWKPGETLFNKHITTI